MRAIAERLHSFAVEHRAHCGVHKFDVEILLDICTRSAEDRVLREVHLDEKETPEDKEAHHS